MAREGKRVSRIMSRVMQTFHWRKSDGVNQSEADHKGDNRRFDFIGFARRQSGRGKVSGLHQILPAAPPAAS